LLVVHGLDKIARDFSGCALTIGNFDGVHCAHRKLLDTAAALASKNGAQVVVLTFEPHPLAILRPRLAPPRLTLLEAKLELLSRAGVTATVVMKSEPSLLGLSPEAFVKQVIVDRFHPDNIIEGPSFGFGKDRAGTPQVLCQLAKAHGCCVHIADSLHLTLGEAERVMVSSSLIRNLLIRGRVRDAATCLGRAYSVSALIIHGDGRGRQIGFPTANLCETDQLVPAEGVYAGCAVVGERQHPCAISVGSSPTFSGKTSRVEAHLLDFDDDIYGERIDVHFQCFLRPQQKYSSADALIDQLRRDVEAARKIATRFVDRDVTRVCRTEGAS